MTNSNSHMWETAIAKHAAETDDDVYKSRIVTLLRLYTSISGKKPLEDYASFQDWVRTNVDMFRHIPRELLPEWLFYAN